MILFLLMKIEISVAILETESGKEVSFKIRFLRRWKWVFRSAIKICYKFFGDFTRGLIYDQYKETVFMGWLLDYIWYKKLRVKYKWVNSETRNLIKRRIKLDFIDLGLHQWW